MKRLATLAAALLLAAPMLAADAPKTDPQPVAAPQDSPLVAAAKKASKKRTGKVTVITNATLVKENGSRLTTTDSQTAINLPSPDAALLAMQAKANQPQAKPGVPAKPADNEAQRARAGRAEENGPYSETPQLDERTLAVAQTQQVGTAQTETIGTAQTQQATTAQAQTGQQPTTAQSTSPDSMTKKP